MSIFEGGDNAQILGGKYPKLFQFPGAHDLEVVQVNSGTSFKGEYFGVVLEVKSSTNPALLPGRKLQFGKVKDNRYPQYFFSDIKKTLGAILGQDPEAIKQQHMEACCTDKQPCKGKRVHCDVYDRESKEPGGKKNRVTDFSPAA